MRQATELLTEYAQYHRDRRNISMHLIGVPVMVFALGILLSRPSYGLDGWQLSPAWLVFAPLAAWYLTRGQLLLGLAVSAGMAMTLHLAQQWTAANSTSTWLAWGLGSFVLGWLLQLVGHYYEGRRPAFIDDIVNFAVGPMFVVAEALFSLGWNQALLREIEHHAGPSRLRDLAHPV
jgi:uncharacterized membrane protein YGL010W